jgi:hypothetical protein
MKLLLFGAGFTSVEVSDEEAEFFYVDEDGSGQRNDRTERAKAACLRSWSSRLEPSFISLA